MLILKKVITLSTFLRKILMDFYFLEVNVLTLGMIYCLKGKKLKIKSGFRIL